MGPTWGPPGSCRPQIGPMLASWTLLSGETCPVWYFTGCSVYRYKRINSKTFRWIRHTYNKIWLTMNGFVRNTRVPYDHVLLSLTYSLCNIINTWSTDRLYFFFFILSFVCTYVFLIFFYIQMPHFLFGLLPLYPPPPPPPPPSFHR